MTQHDKPADSAYDCEIRGNSERTHGRNAASPKCVAEVINREVPVPFEILDYLINPSDLDLSTLLSGWSSIVPEKFEPWLVNRFGDLFLVSPNGAIHLLDVGIGTLTKVADSRDSFCDRIDDEENANEWLLIPLVDELVAAAIHLKPGQCYGFKKPPVLGGDYTLENCGPISIADYLGTCGSIHEQLRDVPDGSEVVLKVTLEEE
jgi:hypothetical protein